MREGLAWLPLQSGNMPPSVSSHCLGLFRPPGPSPVLGLTRDGWEDVMKRLHFTLNTAPVENWLCPSTVQGPGCTSARLEKVPS